jgi:hypothetical protein
MNLAICLLLLLMLFWFFFEFSRLPSSSPISLEIFRLNGLLNAILSRTGFSTSFSLFPSHTITFTDNYERIYIVVTREDGSLFDRNTLNLAALHELVHVLTRSSDHNSHFEDVYTYLFDIAVNMKECDRDNDVDANYPCQN